MHGAGPHGPPYGGAGGPDNRDLMEAFDRLARGDLSAETFGRLLNLDDRDFWKGALVGSVAVLALTNMPAIRAAMAGLGAQASAAAAGMAARAPGGSKPSGEKEEKT